MRTTGPHKVGVYMGIGVQIGNNTHTHTHTNRDMCWTMRGLPFHWLMPPRCLVSSVPVLCVHECVCFCVLDQYVHTYSIFLFLGAFLCNKLSCVLLNKEYITNCVCMVLPIHLQWAGLKCVTASKPGHKIGVPRQYVKGHAQSPHPYEFTTHTPNRNGGN